MLITQSILAILQGVLAVSLIGLILLQQGSGADAGVAFGSGSSSTMFGARGAGNLLTRLTTILSALFVINCLALALVYKKQLQQESVLFTQPAEEAAALSGDDVPALPADNDNPAAADDSDESVPVMPLDIAPASETAGADAQTDQADDALTDDGAMPAADDAADAPSAAELEMSDQAMENDSEPGANNSVRE